MRTVLRTIDSITDWTGRIVSWLCVFLVVQITYEVAMRYVFNAPTVWGYETSEMVGCTIFVFAFSYALKTHAHVRIDIIHGYLPTRGKTIIDVLGHLICFFPLIILLTFVSADWATDSWRTSEIMVHGAWYPPAAPWRTVVVAGLILFAIQGAAQFVRDFYLLTRNKPYD